MGLQIGLDLALRLEGAELAAAEGAASAMNEGSFSQAFTMEAAGGKAVFFGPGSPLSQALHIGLRGPVSTGDVDRLEAAFLQHNAPVVISLCPYADPTALGEISRRGYRIAHFENTLVRRIRPEDSFNFKPGVRRAELSDRRPWCETVMGGFSEDGQLNEDLMRGLESIFNSRASMQYLVESQGAIAAGASMFAGGGIALLAGDSTLHSHRGRGYQRAPIDARLRHAAESGCDLAMACTLPGTVSQRNYERCGFQVAYTKTMLLKDWT